MRAGSVTIKADWVMHADAWDLRLFQAVHAATQPSPVALMVARILADGPALLTAALLIGLIAVPCGEMRVSAFRAAGLAVAALMVNGLIGLLWDRPRPFVAGAGPAWIAHAATSSFPSNHLTAQWVIAGVLLLDRRTRPCGLIVAVLGLPMAWARVYLGVHYPSDMLGALGVAGLAMLSAWLVIRRRTRPLTPP